MPRATWRRRRSLTHDAATLQSGGWELQAARAPVGQLPQPANLVATGGDLDGTVDLSWDALRRGVQTYIAQQATSPSGPWTQCYVGKASSCTVTGLTSGTAILVPSQPPSAPPAPAPGATPPPNARPKQRAISGPGLEISPRSGLASLASTCQKRTSNAGLCVNARVMPLLNTPLITPSWPIW